MFGDNRVRVAIIGEDQVHRALGMAFVDAELTRLTAAADWIELDNARVWCAPVEHDNGPVTRQYFVSSKMPKDLVIAGQRPVNFRARPDGARMSPDVVFFRKLIF